MRVSKRFWYVFLAICVLLLLSATVYSASQNRTSFKELVLDQLKESGAIRELDIVRNRNRPNEQQLKVTEQAEIDRIVNSFSDLKLRKNSVRDHSGDEYEIRLITENGPTFTLVVYSPDHILIYNHSSNHKRYGKEYKIVSDFAPGNLDTLFR